MKDPTQEMNPERKALKGNVPTYNNNKNMVP